MLERLLWLKVPLIAVLEDESTKEKDRALLLKDKEWSMASDLVEVLRLFERATTILSGKQYPTLSLLLPVIAGLRKAGRADTLPQQCSRAIKNFQAHLTQELGKKFDVSPASATVLAVAVDPHFRSLLFFKTEKEQVQLKAAMLQRMTSACSLEEEKKCYEQPPLKKAKSALDENL